MKNRAYSLLEVKEVDAEKRLITGIASTPTPDRMNDIIELDGMDFKTPLPFLWQHNSRQPIGHVISAKKTKDGLEIKAQIAGDIAPWITEAWNLIKAGLVRGLSIGFKSIEEAWNKETGGYRFLKTELFEISAVTIPANSEANILTVKSADASSLAASGQKSEWLRIVRLAQQPPGVSGLTHIPRGTTMKTIQEQIASFEAKRAADEAARTEIMTKASDEGRTLDDTETERYDGLTAEIKSVDAHLVRLRAQESDMIARATRVSAEVVKDPAAAATVRQGGTVSVKSNAPKGIGIARMAIALIKAEGNRYYAGQIAKEMWPDAPEVHSLIMAPHQKAAVEAGDTTTSGWASQLIPAAQQTQTDFLELLRPATILGKLEGRLRRVPFNIAVPVQTAGGSYSWVGEGAAKPVTSLTFDSVTLRWAKAAGIIVITQELAKFSTPSAEMIVRDDMIQGIARFLDGQFISANAAVSNVSPAGILNGISAITPSGTTAAALRVDINNLLNNFAANNVDPTGIVLIMSATQAIALSLLVTDLGVTLFPTITVNGGTLLGMSVIISEPVGTRIIALNARDILLAEDGGVQIDVSTQASVEMSSTPIAGDTSPITGAVLKSLWQNNLVGIRVEKFITWLRGRTSAVEYINGNAYTPS